MPLTRQTRCPSCGATEEILSDALLVFCSYCGVLVALESSQCWSGDNLRELARRHRRQLIAPTASDARKTWLLRQLERCRLQQDQPGLRAAAREYYSLLALTDPELVPGAGQSVQALREWLACAVAEYELLSFDPQIKAAYAELSRIGGGLCRSADPVGLAGEMLTAAGRYYTLLSQHPDHPLPQHSRSDELAKSMVRAWVTPQAAMMAKGQATRILTEVLGDRPAAAEELRCPSCGAQLPPATEGAQQCPYCGGVLRLGSDDPWLSGLLASWQLTDDCAADEETLAAAALLSPLQSYQISGEAPTAADCYRFLRQAVPWMPRELLLEKLQLYLTAYEQDPQLGPMFSQLEQLLASWQPGPRPAPPAESSAPTSPSPAEQTASAEDPWVCQTLVHWERARAGVSEADLELSLLSMTLTPFYLGGAIRPEQALAFFARAEPAFSPRKLQEAIALLSVAHQDNPALCRFLQQLAAQL